MTSLLIGAIIGVLIVLANGINDDRYALGYQDGKKAALSTNPVSEDLELTCAGLWLGEQAKKRWRRENAGNAD